MRSLGSHIELDCGGGTAWFGLRHDGANVAQGQSVTMPCDGAILGCDHERWHYAKPIDPVKLRRQFEMAWAAVPARFPPVSPRRQPRPAPVAARV